MAGRWAVLCAVAVIGFLREAFAAAYRLSRHALKKYRECPPFVVPDPLRSAANQPAVEPLDSFHL
jgi:hypothetical protein